MSAVVYDNQLINQSNLLLMTKKGKNNHQAGQQITTNCYCKMQLLQIKKKQIKGGKYY